MVSPEGEQIGITPLNEALEQALNLDLDLVEVAENANPTGLQNHGLRKI